jgi:hypothetical protein
MRFAVLAALAALVSASPLTAQPGASTLDPASTTPLSGSWTYSATLGATEADFIGSDSRTQLALKCARAARQVWISKPSAVPVTQLSVWTSEMTRNVSATFNPSTGQATALLNAYDPLLDALALSRARIALGVPGAAPLVLPSSPEVARIVEDCRA